MMKEKTRKFIHESTKIILVIAVTFFTLFGIFHFYYGSVYCEVMSPEEFLLYKNFSDNYTVGIYANIEQLTYFYNHTWYGTINFPPDYSYKCGFLKPQKLYRRETQDKIYNIGNITFNFSTINNTFTT